ncbi:cation transporter [Pseudoduganella chitinolytica]|uniref:Cation transporter n=1 Tax=Pseudoduganella chitinolytica TaxID=34070 RepID=A0ABY8B7N2_9BURK|nr:cation transporter [Pseudoduganella chitinolytica]WEF31018.1 cation transporter [Pseudoduganella chitinolytica]
MSACCSGGCSSGKPPVDGKYRRILWIALFVNAIMFAIELYGGISSGSVSLLADAVDFFGDAANYGVSLFVLALASLWRSRTALLKGAMMGAYGIFVLASAGWHFVNGTVPQPVTMGVIAALALVSNLGVALLLYAYRNGDADMRSVWLCSRNDAIGNVAVMLAAFGVFGTRSGWPDIVVACVIGLLGMTASRAVIKHALAEMRSKPAQFQGHDANEAVELKRR